MKVSELLRSLVYYENRAYRCTPFQQRCVLTAAHNVQHVKGIVIGLHEKGQIRVTVKGKQPRIMRVNRFFSKYPALLHTYIYSFNGPQTYENLCEVIRVQLGWDEYDEKKVLAHVTPAIVWISEKWYLAATGMGLKHEMLQGNDIFEPYLKIHSCMSGDDAVGLYAQNPDRVRLMHILNEHDQTVGRALVWKTDDGRFVLDRVYPSDNGPQTVYARRIARKNGWLYRSGDSYDSKVLKSSNEYLNDAIEITLKDVKQYPYLDTFRYGKRVGDDLLKLSNEYFTGAYDFQEGGNYYPEDAIECYNCEEMIDAEDSVEVASGDYVCESCLNQYYIFVETDTHEGYYQDHEVVYDEIDEISRHKDENIVTLTDGRKTHIDNAVQDEEGDYIAKTEAVPLWNGENWTEDAVVQIEHGPYKGYYERDDLALKHDGLFWVNRDFEPEEEEEEESIHT